MKTWEKILIVLFFVWVLFWFAVLRPSIMARRSAATSHAWVTYLDSGDREWMTNRFDCIVTNSTNYTVFSNCVIVGYRDAPMFIVISNANNGPSWPNPFPRR